MFLTEYLRCSRPLCSSQNTGGIPCPSLRSDKRIQRSVPDAHPFERLEVRSLRTQQRAKDQGLRRHLFRLTEVNVLGCQVRTWSQCQCSTHERHRRTYVSEMTWQLVPASGCL
jgi:hypothetical protein